MQVDIDAAELRKPTFQPKMPIHCDLKIFLEEMERQLAAAQWQPARHAAWLAWCRQRVAKYPVVLPKHRAFNGAINPYHFIEVLFERLADDDVVVCGNATACIVPFQAAKLRTNQRLFSNSGAASMGYDLPAAIGAGFARGGKRVVCLAGDGSIQMNLQELQTLVHHRLPVKIFVLSNGGYLSIRSTQQNLLGHCIGEGPATGVSFPDMCKLATAYGIANHRICQAQFSELIDAALAGPGPFLADVVLDRTQPFELRLASKQLPDGRLVTAPLEDMFPFLDREELRGSLFIPEMEF